MLYALARPFLFGMDAERAHKLSLAGLETAYRTGTLRLCTGDLPETPVEVMGLRFPNPLGLAPGLDKDAEHVDALGALGFGFIEVGGVTPKPQPGNPKPRVFRLPEAEAVINRLGFNSQGLEQFARNLAASRYPQRGGIVGVNLGKNKDTPIERAADDYVTSLERVYTLCSYATVNVSSPNTQNLRQLQGEEALDALLATVAKTRERLSDKHGRRLPLAVKIAPDMEDAQLEAIAKIAVARGMDAIVAVNTTTARDAVRHLPHGEETGGLSGGPLRERGTQVIAKLARLLDGAIPIIGSGGIMSAEHALEKLDAGAKLVQLYTGLIFHGPELVGRVVRGIHTARAGVPHPAGERARA
jgi:dihydroorotate dehydrogenase